MMATRTSVRFEDMRRVWARSMSLNASLFVIRTKLHQSPDQLQFEDKVVKSTEQLRNHTELALMEAMEHVIAIHQFIRNYQAIPIWSRLVLAWRGELRA